MAGAPKPKFCKDCRHFEPPRTPAGNSAVPAQCAHPQNVEWDLVFGTQKRQFSPQQMRGHEGPCTRQASLFEARKD
jgi:hypothetical protein